MNWSIVTRFINCRSWVARPLAQEMEPETAMFGILGRLCTEIWEAFLWKERNTQQVCREKEEAYTPESDRSIESSALITVQFPWGTHSALLVTPKHLHKNAASTSNQGSFSGLPFLTEEKGRMSMALELGDLDSRPCVVDNNQLCGLKQVT